MPDLIPHQPSSFFHITDRDILAELLADKRSPETRRAYARNLKYFFKAISGLEPTPQLVAEFLKLERFTAIGLVLNYKNQIIDQGLSENTVNQRLAAIKSLVKFAGDIGKCEWSLESIAGEKVQTYRDTSGVNAETYSKMLAVPDRSTLPGLRNYAILRLLWDNALRRSEVCKCNIADLSLEPRQLKILGKGKGTQQESIDLSLKTTEAIWAWLQARGINTPAAPLFCSLDRATPGHRLSGNAIYSIVRQSAEAAGISKRMSPHRCRHSSITAAAKATNGNVSKIKKLSRHAKTDTVLVYIDNLERVQGEVTDLLSDLV